MDAGRLSPNVEDFFVNKNMKHASSRERVTAQVCYKIYIVTYDPIITSFIDTKRKQLLTQSHRNSEAIILSHACFVIGWVCLFRGGKLELLSLEKSNGEVDISKITFYGNEKDSDLVLLIGFQGRGGGEIWFLVLFFLKTGWRLGGEMDVFCWPLWFARSTSRKKYLLRFHSVWSVCFWGPNTKPQEVALDV